MTLYEAIFEAIEGPCRKASDALGGVVSPEAWAAIIGEAVTEWAQATAIQGQVLASLIERTLFPMLLLNEDGTVVRAPELEAPDLRVIE